MIYQLLFLTIYIIIYQLFVKLYRLFLLKHVIFLVLHCIILYKIQFMIHNMHLALITVITLDTFVDPRKVHIKNDVFLILLENSCCNKSNW
jgi:hypothetical protein